MASQSIYAFWSSSQFVPHESECINTHIYIYIYIYKYYHSSHYQMVGFVFQDDTADSVAHQLGHSCSLKAAYVSALSNRIQQEMDKRSWWCSVLSRQWPSYGAMITTDGLVVICENWDVHGKWSRRFIVIKLTSLTQWLILEVRIWKIQVVCFSQTGIPESVIHTKYRILKGLDGCDIVIRQIPLSQWSILNMRTLKGQGCSF